MLLPRRGFLPVTSVTSQCLQGFPRFWSSDNAWLWQVWKVDLSQCLQGCHRCHGLEKAAGIQPRNTLNTGETAGLVNRDATKAGDKVSVSPFSPRQGNFKP